MVIVMLSGLLVACERPALEDAPTGKLVVWGSYAITQDLLRASGVVEDYRDAYPDVDIEIRDIRTWEIYNMLSAALEAGQGGPDVCLVGVGAPAYFARQGFLLDLTEYMLPYLDDLADYEGLDCWGNGKYYCVPLDGGPMVMYYRRDVFDAAGLPTEPDEVSAMIATWDDYLEVCRAIKARTGIPCFSHNKANNQGVLYQALLSQQGLGYYDEQTGEVTVDRPENIATLEMLGRFWQEDLVSDSPPYFTAWYNELGSLDRPVATLITTPWLMERNIRPRIGTETSGRWGVAYIPAYQRGGTRAVGLVAPSNPGIFVIPRQSQNPAAAWAFIEFVMTRKDSQLAMLAVNGFVPSLKSVLDDLESAKGDPFYAGQNPRLVYADVNDGSLQVHLRTAPSYVYTEVNKAIHRYAAAKVTAPQALQEAADVIRAELD